MRDAEPCRHCMHHELARARARCCWCGVQESWVFRPPRLPHGSHLVSGQHGTHGYEMSAGADDDAGAEGEREDDVEEAGDAIQG